ncbi:FAD binding domain-containing protein [Chloroflexota bacterium]
MIIEYHRPQTIEDALALLSRTVPVTVPLAGGSALNRPSARAIAAVDLQLLGLDTVSRRTNYLDLGAMLTLQTLLYFFLSSVTDDHVLQEALIKAIKHEATYNLRQVATIVGTLVSAGGRSPFTTAMLALDASIRIVSASKKAEAEEVSLGDLLPFRTEMLKGRLITKVTIPSNTRLAYEYVARSPADLPIVCAAVSQWSSGRTRVALGGFGSEPVLAFDGPESGGIEEAAISAYSRAEDEWASASYRKEIAGILALRCLKQ